MSTLTQKSQVTIPKQFRQALGIGPGDEVEFSMKRNGLVVRKKPKKLPLDKWRGYLGRIDVDKAMHELRG